MAKIDVAEYMLTHTKEDLEQLPGQRVYDIILNQMAPADKIPADVLDKLEVARKIITELSFLPEPARKAYVFETVRDRLKIKRVSDLKAKYSEVVESQPVEYPSIEVTFLRGNGQVRTKKLGNCVMGLNHYITMKDTKEVYIYKDGVYVPGGEDVIKKDVQDILGDYSTEQRQKEIVNYIRNLTLISRDDIGNDCTKINMLNGLYKLDTGELEPHTPNYISIRQLPVNYDPNARCEKIGKFLSEVMDDKYIQTTLEFIGYAMIPDTRIQQSVMVYGPGRGGKSVLLSLIESFIGGCNCSRQSLHRLENDKYSVAELYGKLVNIFPDLASTTLYDSNMFKQLTGNEKTIPAERKYIPQFRFRNTARLIFSANDLPPAPNGNYAFWRRWILIKMDRVFDGKNEDKKLIDKLSTPEELSGLFNKAADALKTLLQNDEFSYDHSVDEVARMYLMASEPVAAFSEECIEISVDNCLKAVMYSNYRDWCKIRGQTPKAPNMFAKALRRLGYEAGKSAPSQGSLPIWIGCTCTLPGSDNQPGEEKTPAEEPPCRVAGLETPIVTQKNEKNKETISEAVEKKDILNERIGPYNPATRQTVPQDSENALPGSLQQPGELGQITPVIEECLDLWEKTASPIFKKNAHRAKLDIVKYNKMYGVNPQLIFEAVDRRAGKRCLDCGSEETHHETNGEGRRCNACHKKYSNPSAVVIPDEISLDPAEVTL